MTPQSLRLLLVEDMEDDALLLVRELRKGGIDLDFTRVETPRELKAALANGSWDAIFADYNLPAFTGLDALRIVRKMDADLPFILISGLIGEETAVEALHRGAHDFILKGRFARLVPALKRALQDAKLRHERRRTAAELTQHREHLEELVQMRTAELAAVNRELAAANRELETFSHTVAHDLRNPVVNIAGFCRVIFEKYEHLLDEKCMKCFRLIHKEARRMDKLIITLLNFSRMSRQEMQLQETDLSEMARNISRELQPTAQGRRAEFFITDNLSCHGDQNLLKVALGNLLGNAWKYSSKKALSTIEFGTICGDGPAPTFYVRDNGVGFNQNYAHRLFGLFQRLHSNDDFEGHGIGLVTVERIIHRHGGRVWAESKEGEGATFYFTLKGGGHDVGSQGMVDSSRVLGT
jgi:signal transduction histidine kinase